jgi:hypothetical protein
MVVWLETETGVIGKGGAKRRAERRGGVCRGKGVEAAGFGGPCVCVGVFPKLAEGACVSNCRGGECVQLEHTPIVGCECVGGKYSVVTGWRRI